MAKHICILQTNPDQHGRIQILYVAWFAIPLPRRVPLQSVASQWIGVTQDEITRLVSGEVLEETRSLAIPDTATATEIKGLLVKDYAARAADLASKPNKLQHAGVIYDDVSGWSA